MQKTLKIPVFCLAAGFLGCSDTPTAPPCAFHYANFHWIATADSQYPYRLVYDSTLVCSKRPNP